MRRGLAFASLWLVALGAGVSVTACGETHRPATAPGEGTVVRAVDGDTVDVRLNGHVERVRLIGIDTPETVSPDRPVECFGHEASARTAELLTPGTRVRLERDVEARDRYGRLLAHVVRLDDGVWVNESLVADGFAIARSYPPNTTRSAELRASEAIARRASAGLWAACGGADVTVDTGADSGGVDRR